MLLIPCPWCGERVHSEFVCGGEGHIRRPDPESASDEEWAAYLFMRKNPKGPHCERWFHAHGCRRWFHLARDTVSHAILAAYGIDEPPPALDDGQAGR